MDIDADFDGGAIEVVRALAPTSVELALRPDNAADFLQWFSFRARGKKGRRASYRIINAGEATYADAWAGYRVCASEDSTRWIRVPTRFEDGALSFSYTQRHDTVHFAYFAPYPFERHETLVARAGASPRVRVLQPGASTQGRPMSALVWGDEDDEALPHIWITARQHPGETMAEWFMEGLVARLLDEADPLTQALAERAVFYLVPNMNPDGGVLGNLRTNAAGVNLNRVWTEPSEAESPEVACVRGAMFEAGVDMFLDIHGDERTPYCFAAGCEGNPGYSARIASLEELFLESLLELDDDFQREQGYGRDAPGEGDLTTAGNYVGEVFDCLSLTIEMPFKDNANRPDARVGWSPERAMHFGRTTLESVFVCLDSLR